MNKHRGEVEITLTIDGDERKLAMRPTFQFIAEVESSIAGIPDMIRRLALGQWKIVEIIGLVEAAVAHDKDVKRSQVRDAVLEHGPQKLIDPLSILLANALTGGEDEGNSKAATS